VWIKWEAFEWLRHTLSAAGYRPIYVPWIGAVPAPTEVVQAWLSVLHGVGYWQSWYMSFLRVLAGFLAAMVIGIPFGLLLAVSRYGYGVAFPVFEVLRPIPPLAWVPASIIFWPTRSCRSLLTFLGAFFTIVINVSAAHVRSTRAIFRLRVRWVEPDGYVLANHSAGTLPSIIVGCAVGMGITWEVVVAAEMISGGGSQIGGDGGGLGFFIWKSYIGGAYEQIVVA